MSERNIKGTWRWIKTSPSIPKHPMIGMIYRSGNKVGVLVSSNDNESQLQLQDKSIVTVQTKSLKLIINEQD